MAQKGLAHEQGVVVLVAGRFPRPHRNGRDAMGQRCPTPLWMRACDAISRAPQRQLAPAPGLVPRELLAGRRQSTRPAPILTAARDRGVLGSEL